MDNSAISLSKLNVDIHWWYYMLFTRFRL